MTRRSDLEKLLILRQGRLRGAESALAGQQARCEAARLEVAAAAARVAEHHDRRSARERELLGQLLGRTVTLNQIERIRTAFAVFEEQGADLDRAERDADKAMRTAFALKQTLAADCNRRRCEHDKMSGLVSDMKRAAHRRAEAHAEAEQEERVPVNAAHRWPF